MEGEQILELEGGGYQEAEVEVVQEVGVLVGLVQEVKVLMVQEADVVQEVKELIFQEEALGEGLVLMLQLLVMSTQPLKNHNFQIS